MDRTPVMYNDFIIIADKSLASKFKGKNLKESLELIKNEKLTFISRGDKSGTDNKEKVFGKILEVCLKNKAGINKVDKVC